VLQNTSLSVNIKERLDFSCAVFDAEGRLVANAPHIPIHLGAMGESVQTVLRLRRGTLKPGDVVTLNNPYNGGTHLPDVTVITPRLAVTPRTVALHEELERRIFELAETAADDRRQLIARAIAYHGTSLGALSAPGITSPRQLREWRRYAIVATAVLAMVLPGTDPVSMILEFLILYALYELSLLMARFMDRGKAERASRPGRWDDDEGDTDGDEDPGDDPGPHHDDDDALLLEEDEGESSHVPHDFGESFRSLRTSLLEKPLAPSKEEGIYSYGQKYLQTDGLSAAPRELPAQVPAAVLKEAERLGFERAVVPSASMSDLNGTGLEVKGVATLREALENAGVADR